MTLTISRLEAVRCVADSGSYAAAARQLGVSQPNVSKQIRTLESDYGIRLFRREGGRLVPTLLCLDLCNAAERMAEARGKLAVLSETGLEGVPDDDWWTNRLLRAIEADLAAGHSAVIQVVSTSEAVMERRLEEIPPSEWDDLQVDFTPRENIMDYLMHSFPTRLFEPYTDESGDLRSRPAVDGDGNHIICREAERRRDELVEHLGALAPVQGALDQILWHFGGEAVAEVTGRKRRIVKTRSRSVPLPPTSEKPRPSWMMPSAS